MDEPVGEPHDQYAQPELLNKMGWIIGAPSEAPHKGQLVGYQDCLSSPVQATTRRLGARMAPARSSKSELAQTLFPMDDAEPQSNMPYRLNGWPTHEKTA